MRSNDHDGRPRQLRLEPLEPRRLLSTSPFPVPLQSVAPSASLAYRGSVDAELAAGGETDDFTIDLDDGQTVTIAVAPGASLRPTVELLDVDQVSLATTSADASGQQAVLQAVGIGVAGTYTIRVGGAGDTAGTYEVELVLNALLEAEPHGGPANDEASSAESLGASMQILPGGIGERAAVLGTLAESDDWYRFTLDDGQSATLAIAATVADTLQIELFDDQEVLLSIGMPTAMADQVIGSFVDRTSDGDPNVYFVRVMGAAETDYCLVATRDADFGIHRNDESTPHVQDISPTGTALGYFDSTVAKQWSYGQKLTASDASTLRFFGRSVSMHGEEAIVGSWYAPDPDIAALNGAYVFRFDGQQWSEEQKLTPWNVVGRNDFGRAVAIEGDTAMVSNTMEDHQGPDTGAVYVFRNDGAQWVAAQRLVASDSAAHSRFGYSLAIHGDVAIVGASPSGEDMVSPGTVYVFRFDGNEWAEEQRLQASDSASRQSFGSSVAIDGATIVVGSIGDSRRAKSDGSVYVFKYDGTQWVEQQKLTASEAFEHSAFGDSVDISGEWILVGAQRRGASHRRTSYAFQLVDGSWVQREIFDEFGSCVAIEGKTAIISNAWDEGTAYVFNYVGTQWIEAYELRIPNGQYASWVAMTNNATIVATVKDGHAGSYSGAAHIFTGVIPPVAHGVDATSGDTLTITTTTPGDGPGEPLNAMDPQIELFDPDGELVAEDDNSAADQRNAVATHVAEKEGTYVVHVTGENDTGGAYVLNIDGHGGPPPNFSVDTIDPAPGSEFVSRIEQVTVDFNYPILLSSLHALDLTVDGRSASAYTVIDGDTVVFHLPYLYDGAHRVAIAPGVILSTRGTPIEAYEASFTVDPPPRVIASSILDHDLIPTGSLVFTAQFDEPLATALLSRYDMKLVGENTGSRWASDFHYDPAVSHLTARYDSLPKDDWTLTLRSGDREFVGLSGHALDGEVLPEVTTPSGDGLPGGDFVVHFSTADDPNEPYFLPGPLRAERPLGSMIYNSSMGAWLSPADDVDRLAIKLDGKQTVTIVVSPSQDLQPIVKLLDPEGAVLGESSAADVGETIVMQSIRIEAGGMYTVSIANGSDIAGQYDVELYLNAAMEEEEYGGDSNDDRPSAQDLDSGFISPADSLIERAAVLGQLQGSEDWYRFSSEDGQTVGIFLQSAAPAETLLDLYAEDGTLLAIGEPTGDSGWAIRDFLDTMADGDAETYYLRVHGTGSYDYSLMVTRGAGFDTHATCGLEQRLPLSGVAWGYLELPRDSSEPPATADVDCYTIRVESGNVVTIRTETPGDEAGEFVNRLDPVIRLYDPSGELAADEDNGHPDERNVILQHMAETSGIYEVHVAASRNTQGEYVLQVEGQSESVPSFSVSAMTPADGSETNPGLRQITVAFDSTVLLSSLDASDLTVGGVAASGLTIMDHHTVAFHAPRLFDGGHHVEIAAGEITNLQGTPLERFVGDFAIDAPPYVVDSTLAQDAVLPMGPLECVIQFDEPLDVDVLDSSDVSLEGVISGRQPPTKFEYDADNYTLSLEFANLIDDIYSLTLDSSTDGFRNQNGYLLDGELEAGAALPSGNGLLGGDFVVHFSADAEMTPYPGPLTALKPLGSLVYNSSEVTAALGRPDDLDSYAVELDSYQSLTVLLESDQTATPTVEVRDPTGVVIASATVAEPGQKAIIQTAPIIEAGTYVIAVGGEDSIGPYTVQWVLNAAVEHENHGGPANDDLDSAEDLEAGFVSLPGNSGQRGAVLGTFTGSEDWYQFTLADGQSVTLALEPALEVLVQLELYDNDQTLLGMGLSTPVADSVISNFVDQTSDGAPDTYYVRIMADHRTDYVLLMTRDADFGIHRNDESYLHVQDLPPSGTILGHFDVAPAEQWIHWQKLTASDAASFRYFGQSVAISGDTAIVGAWYNGNSQTSSNSAYIFRFDGRQWMEEQQLTPWDTGDWNEFGGSVSISGDMAIVGARSDDRAGRNSGIAYAFRYDGTQWVAMQKLEPLDPAASRGFGKSLSIQGNVAIVGAPSSDDVGESSGAAYVFRFDGNQWSQEQKLLASDAKEGHYFGNSVTIDGDVMVVGASLDDHAGERSGSAYVFRYDGSQWIEEQKLTASDAGDNKYFGRSVATNTDMILIGADHGPSHLNAVYVFHLENGQWSEQDILTDYGNIVDVGGDTAFIVNGRGTAYEFHFDGTTWIASDELTSPDMDNNGFFGRRVSVSDDTAIIAAVYDSHTEPNAGAAHILRAVAPALNSSVQVAAGDTLTITTQTPGMGAGAPVNALNPRIELYDPSGNLVAEDDDSSPDEINAVLTYTAAVAGNYTVRLLAVEETGGAYVLNVDGQTGPATPFHAEATDPADGKELLEVLERVTVDFDGPVLLGTLNTSDLTVDGVAAIGLTIIDADTVEFELPPMTEGLRSIEIAAGAVLDLQGTPVEAYSSTFDYDFEAPRVIASTVLEGGIVPTGDLQWTIQFDDELDEAHFDIVGVSLVGVNTGLRRPSLFDYDPATLTLTLKFPSLPEDDYTLTLDDGRFQDPNGRQLDGDGHPETTVPSGNGYAGGNFVVHFAADVQETPYPLLPVRTEMLGSLVFESILPAKIGTAGDLDRFTIDLEVGQTIALLIDSGETLRPTVKLLDPGGGVLGQVMAPEPGTEAFLQAVSTTQGGTYTIEIAGSEDSSGEYTLRTILGAALEEEAHGGPSNDEPATAEDLQRGEIGLPGTTARHSAVLGVPGGSDDWYHFELQDGQSASLALDALEGTGWWTWQMELHDADSNLLTKWARDDNTGSIINSYVDSTSDGVAQTYYVRLVGQQEEYCLSLLKDGDFDSRSVGYTDSGAQDIGPGGTVFGYAGLGPFSQPTDSQRLMAPIGDIGGGRYVAAAVDGDWAFVGSTSDSVTYTYQFDGSEWRERDILPQGGGPSDICGDLAIVGSWSPSDDDWIDGAAYVLRFDGNQWIEEQKLRVSGPSGSVFARSVAICGSWAVGQSSGGEAFVFHYDGDQWVQWQELHSVPGAHVSVAINDDTLVVGGATASSSSQNVGKVMVYRLQGDQWNLEQELIPSQSTRGGYYGKSVSLSGDTIFVGAPGYDMRGAAYVFEFDGLQWVESRKLVSMESGPVSRDHFGNWVAVDGKTAIVAEWSQAYVYHFDGNRWILRQELDPLSPFLFETFRTLALQGDTAILGGDPDGSGPSAHVLKSVPHEYDIRVKAGDPLTVTTSTPGDDPRLSINNLDPGIELYDPDGVLVAWDDNSAADGRNARLTHTATVTGTYSIRVLAHDGTAGEFVLNVDGTGNEALPFQVVDTEPNHITSSPGEVIVHLNHGVLIETVQATDLTVDGIAADNVTIVSANTLRFTIPDFEAGVREMTISEGAFQDIQGTPIDAFAGQLITGATGPRVIASSIMPGDILADGTFTYTARFSEPMNRWFARVIVLEGLYSGKHSPFLLDYDPTTMVLTAQFDDLPNDRYELRLNSFDRWFQNSDGVLLDGELDPSGTLPSGNAEPGGHFVVEFLVDASGPIELPPIHYVSPLGSLIYDASTSAVIATAQDVDYHTIDLQADQTLVAIVEPLSAWRPVLEVLDPDGMLIDGSTSSEAGIDAVSKTIFVTQAGVYTLKVGSADGTSGDYTVRALLNSVVESESRGGTDNGEAVVAEDIEPEFIDLADGAAQRAAVLGSHSFDPAMEDDWYRFSLEDGQSTTLVLAPSKLSTVQPIVFDSVWKYDQLGDDLGTAWREMDYDDSIWSSGAGMLGRTDRTLSQPIQTELEPDGQITYYFRTEFEFDGKPEDARLHLRYWPDDGVIFYLNGKQFYSRLMPYGEIDANTRPTSAYSPSNASDWKYFSHAVPVSGRNVLAAEVHQAATDMDDVLFGAEIQVYMPPRIELYDADLSLVATGTPSDLEHAVIRDFTDETGDGEAETYYARVSGSAAEYTLLVLRDATFADGSAQDLTAGDTVLGAISQSQEVDQYLVTLDSGDGLLLTTHTPGDRPGSFDNHLNPAIELYDPQGRLVAANGNGAPDGHNALLAISAATGGEYTIRVSSEGSTGEYVLTCESIDLYPGDANLDDVTDVRDFMIWNANKFTGGTDWMTGDFNGDGLTDVRDFMIWNVHKFTSAPDPAPAHTQAVDDVLGADATSLSELVWLSPLFDFGLASTRDDDGEKSDEVTDKVLATYW